MSVSTPLAERLRPKTLDEYVGQQHLVGPGAVLRNVIESGILPSIILWGPPGVGKTTLANIIANNLDRPFYTLSAISSGVKDVREVIDKVNKQGFFGGQNAILFIDEIHRFSKAQQDSLLGAVEKGIITLIGATTENPSFEVISALLSRCQVYTLKHHTKYELIGLLERAMKEDSLFKTKNILIKEYESLLRLSGGDARKLLNIFEIVVQAESSTKIDITNTKVEAIVHQNASIYDKDGDQHYDIISAFIKSIRGSDPNGAVYWLARMVEGGEDPKFIARRMIISASEDIGLANPTALVIANNTFQSVNVVGWPESRIILSQCAIYLATSPKSNASYKAINLAQQSVKQTGNLQVPLHLRNAPTKLMKELGYGENYQYSHNATDLSSQEYLPEDISGTSFFKAGDNSREKNLAEQLKNIWKDKYEF